ncbi:hypothetical protein PAXINDRAFT_172093 [Paxillus involutus ATCC 200175]|uniref:Actin cytoskeleton-regulatory complex protein PAN1 n=1 Tax=Paxillus involutus ATCC 200175 TaxID=664439 RepID=A0A0C9T4T3_PAXIN|nr:hypothetical protein PAXINDRAFT_172093 [Paxillus involutus ATCC 200175]
MSQWGQPGFQYPVQTGFPVGFGGLAPQPTGFPGARPPPPPVPPLPSHFQHKNMFLAAQPTGVGLGSQHNGFAGRTPASLVPQVTGFVDPRLQLITNSFMPANITSPYTSGGTPQLAPPPQQHNQSHGRGTTPKVPWVLSKAEKKQYDQIFRAWDAQGTGFVNGETALEVFGQSGLDRNDLARIWTLADADNRGKLNLAEFHVAMGLIYRTLRGNDIPDELPHELVPPSSRDLDTSVDFLKDILKNDTRARAHSPSGFDTPVSRLKERSFTSSSSSFTQQGGRQDATVYKHQDTEPPGGFYQPRNRHVDRSAVRSRADNASPAASDLSSIKRQLLNTQKMLDDTLVTERSSDALDRDLEDLRYRITRLQEDLEYVSKGPRTTTKDEEKRRLERELVRLMHEEVPELERKLEEREAKREREKREWTRDRDRRNQRSGRFGDDDSGRYSPASRYRQEEERPYSRSASRYDRDDRDYDRDRSYRDRDVDRDRELSPATRTPPPPPPAAPTNNISQPPPAPPAPARSPAPAMKNMTPAERQAFIRAEAQRRLDARKQALGVVTPSSSSVASPTLDTTIESRLAQDKKEAEERAREAEKQADEREKQRKEKLEAEKALKERKFPSPTRTSTAPAPTPGPVPTPTAPTPKAAPPPPKPRARPLPPPRKESATRAVAPLAQEPAPPAPPVPAPAIRATVPAAPVPVPPAPVEPVEDPEDAALRRRTEALNRRREERAAMLRKLEEEEEEAREAEEAYRARRNQFLAAKAASPTVSPTRSAVSSPVPPPPPAPPVPVPVPPPAAVIVAEEPEIEEAAPPPPPAPISTPPAPAPLGDKSSTNPFSRLMKEGGAGTSPSPQAATANSNPFFRAQTASPVVPPPPKSPGIPPPVKTTYHTAPKDSDDEWDDVMEKEDGDSSDEEVGSRDTRMGLAQQLFGNLLPSRPQSAGPPLQSTGSPGSPPPPAPLAPVAPPAPSAPIAAPAPTGNRSALLSAIEGGARLRKAVTNDRSAAPTSGRVIGGVAPPDHINAAPRPASPPPPPSAPASISPAPFALPPPPAGPLMVQGHGKKESVDWYNGLSADANGKGIDHLPATAEEDEEEDASLNVPVIEVSEHATEGGSELMDDVDRSTEFRVRSLYQYEGQREEDLSFAENTIITAHPSKSGGDWWYGTMVKNGKSGFFPQTYVQGVEQVHATALYAYEGTNSDELPFAEGDVLTIVDRSETDWWKAERDGLVFIVPAAYLEVTEG